MEAMRRDRWSLTSLLVLLTAMFACARQEPDLTQQGAQRLRGAFGVSGVHMAAAGTGGAVRNLPGFASTMFLPNDDGTYPANGPDSGTPFGTPIAQPLGFMVNYYGLIFDSAYVNNNGSITLDAPLEDYTPFDLTSTARQIIAPFFADVDTRFAGSPVTFGYDVVDGHGAFGVSWIDVDYYFSDPAHTNRNSFQLVLIDRSDIAPQDFDIEFNFDQIQWEAGEASNGDINGLGGNSARVGYSNGTGNAGTFFELGGSAVNGAFLDSNVTTGLVYNMLNSTQPGRYLFPVRSGVVQVTTIVLAPLAGTGTAGQAHTVTATVATNGGPLASTTVSFAVTGANSAAGACLTAADGTCSFTYTGIHPGDDLITATVNVSENYVTTSATQHWDAAPPAGRCPLSKGFWKNHPDAWPVTSLTLGAETYTQGELLILLRSPPRGDTSLILADQLIAAKLNIANGSDAAPAAAAVADADTVLGLAGKLPYGIPASSSDGHAMTQDGKTLDSYNTGSLTPNCIP